MLLDLIVIAILGLCIFKGYRSGFVRTCFSAASYIISIILSFVLYPVVATILKSTPLYDFLVDVVGENLLGTASSGGFFEGFMGGSVVGDGAAGAFAMLLINIIAFILVVIICKILIALFAKVLDIFTKIPVINQFNKGGGIIAGAVLGIVVIYLVLALMLVFEPMMADTFIMEQIESSILTEWMYKSNLIVSLIG